MCFLLLFWTRTATLRLYHYYYCTPAGDAELAHLAQVFNSGISPLPGPCGATPWQNVSILIPTVTQVMIQHALASLAWITPFSWNSTFISWHFSMPFLFFFYVTMDSWIKKKKNSNITRCSLNCFVPIPFFFNNLIISALIAIKF